MNDPMVLLDECSSTFASVNPVFSADTEIASSPPLHLIPVFPNRVKRVGKQTISFTKNALLKRL